MPLWGYKILYIAKDFFEHFRCEPPGIGIVARTMITIEQAQSLGKLMLLGVSEFKGRFFKP